MLRYFVRPEMEVERIFNCVRYKYIKAIYLSEFNTLSQLLDARYNKAFQTLAGLSAVQDSFEMDKSGT